MLAAMGLGAVAAVTVVWREATRDDDSERRVAIVADYVAQCQSTTAPCTAMADAALHVRKDCLEHHPGRRALERGALIWLNAHPETHPLPLEDGMARAVAAVWPRCRAER